MSNVSVLYGNQGLLLNSKERYSLSNRAGFQDYFGRGLGNQQRVRGRAVVLVPVWEGLAES